MTNPEITPIFLFNTLGRQLEKFQTLNHARVGLYTCGPTVYNYAHIGNLRAYIFEDILKRVLVYNGFEVKHVMNITDVGHLTSDADEGEDKMEKGARHEGKTAWDIAKFYTEAFLENLKDLNIQLPDMLCRATDHIAEQIELVQKLEEKGFTYRTSDGIYFDTSLLPDYGKLADLQNQKLKAGARVDLGEKKNPTDFALWKFTPTGEKRQMEWESPWGVGFPGWHIECSAMSVKYLGQPFDIHCGGIDHIPVHHTNEIAQSEAAYDKPLANYWLHNEFVVIPGGDKMAKSADNFLSLGKLKSEGFNPLAYRFLLLQTHYRKAVTFTWEALEAAKNGYNNLIKEARQLKFSATQETLTNTETADEYESIFIRRINDDLDTPNAIAVAWDMIGDQHIPSKDRLAALLKFDKVFGLNIENEIDKEPEAIPPEVQLIVTERDLARREKNWTKSDELRLTLEKMGYTVKDSTEGTKIEKQN